MKSNIISQIKEEDVFYADPILTRQFLPAPVDGGITRRKTPGCAN